MFAIFKTTRLHLSHQALAYTLRNETNIYGQIALQIITRADF